MSHPTKEGRCLRGEKPFYVAVKETPLNGESQVYQIHSTPYSAVPETSTTYRIKDIGVRPVTLKRDPGDDLDEPFPVNKKNVPDDRRYSRDGHILNGPQYYTSFTRS